jgi:hypothetical protein
MLTVMTGTDLYHRTMDFDYGDSDRNAIMHKVWDGFPWMVNAYTGAHSHERDRESEILTWCLNNIGEQASPIHDKPGLWHRGGATVNGWTFMGFASQEDMNRFVERWPAPVGTAEC